MLRGNTRYVLWLMGYVLLVLAAALNGCAGGGPAAGQQGTGELSASAAGGKQCRPVSVPGVFPDSGGCPLLAHLFDAGSYDPDGEIAKWEWNFGVEEDGGWHDYTATGGDAWYTYTVPGTIVAHLRVTDNDGNKSTAFVKIVTAEDLNAAPVAIANGEPLTGNAPLAADFNAAGSYDPDGTIAQWEWDFGEGAGYQDFTSTAGATSHTYDTGGTYSVTLRLTDDDGATATAGLQLEVNNPPTAVAGAVPETGEAPLEVHFAATGSTDADGQIVRWEWDFGEGAGFADYSSTTGTATHTYMGAGDYTAVLRVTDDNGATDTDSVAISVTEFIEPQRGDWWAFGRNAGHDHLSPFVGPAIPQLAWKSLIGGQPTLQSAVFAEDGTTYITSANGNLYALSRGGLVLWSFATGSTVRGTAMVGRRGSIYFAADNGYFYAVDPSGAEEWRQQISNLAGIAACSPIQAANGTIYIGTKLGQLYALTENGLVKWTFQAAGEIQSSPAVAPDGTVYFGSTGAYLYAVNADGTQKWRFATAGNISTSSPAVAADGTVYVGTSGNPGYLHAVNADGSAKWQLQLHYGTGSSPALAANGNIYIADGAFGDGYLYAVRPSGSPLWQLALSDESVSSPAVDANGVIYVGSGCGENMANKLNAVNPNGTFRWRFHLGGWVMSSPALAANGNVLFTCRDGYLYSLGNAVFIF